MIEHPDRIPIEDCIDGHVYKLLSRNLALGVYRSNKGTNRHGPGFIGIRLRFKNRYLFEEYHWDLGPPYGTANPLEDLGPLPEGIEAREVTRVYDKVTDRPVAFNGEKAPEGEGWGVGPYKGWHFTDGDKEYSEAIEPDYTYNTVLFEYLDELEKQEDEGDRME